MFIVNASPPYRIHAAKFHCVSSNESNANCPYSIANSHAAHSVDLSQSGIHAMDDDEISIHMKEGE